MEGAAEDQSVRLESVEVAEEEELQLEEELEEESFDVLEVVVEEEREE